MQKRLKELTPELMQASNWEDLLYWLADAARELTRAAAAGALLFWEEAGVMGIRAHLGAWEAAEGQDLLGEQGEKLLAWLERVKEAASFEKAGELPSHLRRVLGVGDDSAVAIAPLLFADRTIGLIYALRPGLEDLSQACSLLERLAGWATPALAGMAARLGQEEYARALAALHSLGEALPSAKEPEEVLGEFLGEIIQGMPLESGAVYLESTERGRKSIPSAHGPFAETLLAASRQKYGQGFDPGDPIPHCTSLALAGERERQLVQFPIALAAQLHGAMSLVGLPGAVLTQPQVQLLHSLAGCVGTALLARRTRSQEERREGQLATLYQLGKAMASLDRERIVEFALVELAKALPYALSGLLLVDEGEAQLILHSLEPIPGKSREEARRRMLESYRVLTGKELELKDVVVRGPEGPKGSKPISSYLTVPLLAASDVLGILSVNSVFPNAFDDSDLRFLSIAASQMAMALETAHLFRESQRLAITDELTGLHNFRHFQGVLNRELALALRHQYHLALVMIDIDGLKRVNDTYGHLAGNRVLREVAQVIRSSVRRTDVAARIGGDEFAIVMPHTSYRGARSLVSRLREAMKRHKFQVDGEETAVGISMGLASLARLEDKTAFDLVQEADQEQYREKQRKRLV